jgi:alkanesulfonate monooxygenase SsuD/methylene tetrahydromethanopterin reductase-like flavin-dependent oxidoreductase (luciferase family)
MAASSMPAIEWAASQGHSILMDPHCSRPELVGKRRHYAAKLAEAGHSDAGRTIPMARLIAVDATAERARAVAKRVAEWTIAAYVGPRHAGNVRQGPARDFGGKDPIDFYLDDVMIHGTADSVADQIQSLAAEIGMTYLMAAPMSGRSFQLLTDKVLPRIAG